MKPKVIEHDEHSLSYGKYIFGFVSSVVVTLVAYVIAVKAHGSATAGIIASLAVLAMVQFVLQLVFFLHLGEEHKPRWKRLVLWFMIGIVFVIVAGSIWIMDNLNYRMMPEEQEQYLKSQDAF